MLSTGQLHLIFLYEKNIF